MKPSTSANKVFPQEIAGGPKAPAMSSNGDHRERSTLSMASGEPKEKSIYATMSMAAKKQVYVMRIEEDKIRAVQELSNLKTKFANKTPFSTPVKSIPIRSGNIVAIGNHPEGKGYVAGLGNGKAILVEILPAPPRAITIQKPTNETVLAKIPGSIVDIKIGPKGVLAIADARGDIYFFQNGNQINALHLGLLAETEVLKYCKILHHDANHFYFVNKTKDRVCKVNPEDSSIEELDLKRDKIMEISLFENRIFAITETGFIISCISMIKEQINPEESEAYPNGIGISEKEILKFSSQDMELNTVFLKGGLLSKADPKEAINKALAESTGAETLHMKTLMSKSNKSGSKMYECWTNAFYNAASLKMTMYQAIGSCEDYVVTACQDGKGINCLCVFTHALVLKAVKLFRFDDIQDFSYSMANGVQKLKLLKESLTNVYVVASSQKANCVYVFRFDSDTLSLIKKYEKLHKFHVTDIVWGANELITVGRDKEMNQIKLHPEQ